MHRQHILHVLAHYAQQHPAEAHESERISSLVRAQERCFFRDCLPGHITGSAFIVDHRGEHFLLHHHKKLNRWLQFGGHADGETDPLAVAKREALEESGIHALTLVAQRVPLDGSSLALPADVDVHVIPARGSEPEHEHHDLRYVFRAPPEATIAISDESLALRWFPCAELERVVHEAGLLRLARKALVLARDA
jgi:8-oxo-dGTP pyrophosphatase MutT (NUDIX family)